MKDWRCNQGFYLHFPKYLQLEEKVYRLDINNFWFNLMKIFWLNSIFWNQINFFSELTFNKICKVYKFYPDRFTKINDDVDVTWLVKIGYYNRSEQANRIDKKFLCYFWLKQPQGLFYGSLICYVSKVTKFSNGYFILGTDCLIFGTSVKLSVNWQ